MPQFGTLEIRGYRDELVPNTFIEQDNETDHLAVLLPGFAYTCQMPLLYYSSYLLFAWGADVLQADYAYDRRSEYAAASPEEKVRWLVADVTSACRVALGNRPYTRVTVVGKSLGTLGEAYLLTQEYMPARVEAIWLTPVLGHEPFMQQVHKCRARSLFVIGTDDPYYDPEQLSRVAEATGGETLVVEGAGHGMEIEGDIYATLHVLERVMHGVEEFLRKTSQERGPVSS